LTGRERVKSLPATPDIHGFPLRPARMTSTNSDPAPAIAERAFRCRGSVCWTFLPQAFGYRALNCLAFGVLAFVAPDRGLSAQVSWDSHQVRAMETGAPPLLDGFLREGEWGRGGLIEHLVQQEPNEGEPATEQTEIYVLYDAETLYIGVRAWDTSSQGVTATEMRRDSDRILDEDNFQIILDTFKDSRSGYMFVTNPLGAMLDQQVFNEGEGAVSGFGFTTSNVNRNWDGVWHVASRILEDGWVAEIAIPMVTLRFPATDVQDWGLNVMRNNAARNEQSFWAPITKEFTIHRVSMAGSLVGMSGLNRGLDLRVTPFVTGGASSVLDVDVESDDLRGDVGVDMKYGITAGLNLDVTVNTDFAQAEVDDEQVNLTRFPLFFPEKRDFFLENSGQFNVGSATAFNRYADLFFSRRIGLSDTGDNVPIIAGARMTGKIGNNDIAIMDVQTDQAFDGAAENFLVAKFSRNFWSRSRVGALFINKSESGYVGDLGTDYYNRTYAIDALIAPHPNFTVQGFLSKTETPVVAVPIDDPATPIREDEGYGERGSYVNATWRDTKWRIYGEYADFDNDFNPEVGFLPRRGIRTTKLHMERDPRPNFWGIRVLSPMVNWVHTTDQTGRRVADRWHYMMGARFDNGAFFNVWFNDNFDRVDDDFSLNDVVIPAGDYNFGEFRMSFDSNPSRRVYYGAMLAPQGFYGGTRLDTQVKLGARVTDRFSTEAQYTRNDVELPNGAFKVDLAALRVDFAISPAMAIRSVTQYNSFTDQFSTSARFRWTYKPGSDIYLVYNELQRDQNTMFAYRDRSLIVKATFLVTR
jgi:uncharacterized protein DUF5916